MRILGIDPAVRNTGYAILEGDQTSAKALDYGVISIPQRIKQSGALEAVCTGVRNLIEKWNPDANPIQEIEKGNRFEILRKRGISYSVLGPGMILVVPVLTCS